MDGGNLAARSVEIAVSVKLRARRAGRLAARPPQVRCSREPGSNYSGLMLSVALCIADIDGGDAAVHFDPHERQRVRFFEKVRARLAVLACASVVILKLWEEAGRRREA